MKRETTETDSWIWNIKTKSSIWKTARRNKIQSIAEDEKFEEEEEKPHSAGEIWCSSKWSCVADEILKVAVPIRTTTNDVTKNDIADRAVTNESIDIEKLNKLSKMMKNS